MSSHRFEVSLSHHVPEGPAIGLDGLAGLPCKSRCEAVGCAVDVSVDGTGVRVRFHRDSEVFPDVGLAAAGDGGPAAQLESCGMVMLSTPGEMVPWSPLLAAWLAMLDAVERLAVAARLPRLRLEFESRSWPEVHSMLSVSVDGAPCQTRQTEPFFTLGSSPEPGFTRPPKAVPPGNLATFLERGESAWLRPLYRGDLARDTNEPMIAVALWTTALEVASYAAWRKANPNANPATRNDPFNPPKYLGPAGKLGLSLPSHALLACGELWGCRNEIVHNGRYKIRKGKADASVDENNLRDFTWDEGDTMREAVHIAILAML